MTSIGELRRRTLESITRQSYSIYSREMVLLNDNAGLFGANPAINETAETFDFERLWAYPSENSDNLRAGLASEYGVSPDEVIIGNGSDEILDITSKSFLNPGDVLCSPSPTFGMYKFYAQLNFGTVSEKLLESDFSMDADRLLEAQAKIYAICQPNNPTANLFDVQSVRRLLSEAEGIVLLDEAYGDFCGSNMLNDAMNSGKGLDVRTFSKAMGMAGLRVGYAIAPKELINELRRVRTPFGVNSFSEAVAVKALDKKDWVRWMVQQVRTGKEYLGPKLTKLGFRVYPSDCNFLLCKSPLPGPALVGALRSEGVAIRDLNAYPMLENHVRITMAPRQMLDVLLEKLEHLIGGNR